MIIIFPIWLVAIDYLFGFLMSIFIIKFILNILLPEESAFFIDSLAENFPAKCNEGLLLDLQ